MPVLFRGRFRSVAEISAFMKQAHGEASALGGEREGVVLRLARGFPLEDFADNVCKSVRYGRVQTENTGPGVGGRVGLRGVADERYTGRDSRVPRGGRRAHPPEACVRREQIHRISAGLVQSQGLVGAVNRPMSEALPARV